MEESVFGFYVLLLIVGILITLIGIFIFIFKKRTGENNIEVLSCKFRISDASLVIVVMGCLLMIISGLKVSDHPGKVDYAGNAPQEKVHTANSNNHAQENYANENLAQDELSPTNVPVMSNNPEVNYVDQTPGEGTEEDNLSNANVEPSYNPEVNYTLINRSLVEEVYEINFIAGVTQYKCALISFLDGTAKMRVKYYDDAKGTVMVEQDMQIENTDVGLRLAGYNPVYPGTQTSYPNYSPDNLYISQDENGNLSITNIDDQGIQARSSIRKIESYAQQQQFLSGFNWQFN